MLEDTLRDWNPWWAEDQVPDSMVGTPRAQLAELVNLLEVTHIKDIVGVRRCGKTTLMHQLLQHLIEDGTDPRQIALLNFDDPVLYDTEFDELLNTLTEIHPDTRVLLLDEVQEREGWERWVRSLYDTQGFDQILVSGSSSTLLEGDLARVLSGRHVTIPMYPFSFREYLAHEAWEETDARSPLDKDRILAHKPELLHHLRAYLEEGGFPEVIGRSPQARKRVLTTLFQDIVARDVVGRHGAEAQKARKLAKVLLSNAGSPFTYRRLANATGLATGTVTKYTGYLCEAFLFRELPPFSYKVQERYRGPRKFYAIDPGLVATVSASPTPDRGPQLEAAIVLELWRRGHKIYHWRGPNQEEVDVVVEAEGTVETLVQVCYDLSDPTTKERELDALRTAMDELNVQEGTVATWSQQDTLEQEEGTVRVVPAWKLLLGLEPVHPP